MAKAQNRRPWTSGEIALAIRLYETLPAKQVALQLGRSLQSFHSMIHRESPRHKQRLRNIDEQVRQLVAAGWYDRDIAKHLRRDRSTIAAVRKRLGLAANRRPPGVTFTVDGREALALQKQGWTIPKLAQHYGVSIAAVNYALKRAREAATGATAVDDTRSREGDRVVPDTHGRGDRQAAGPLSGLGGPHPRTQHASNSQRAVGTGGELQAEATVAGPTRSRTARVGPKRRPDR